MCQNWFSMFPWVGPKSFKASVTCGWTGWAGGTLLWSFKRCWEFEEATCCKAQTASCSQSTCQGPWKGEGGERKAKSQTSSYSSFGKSWIEWKETSNNWSNAISQKTKGGTIKRGPYIYQEFQWFWIYIWKAGFCSQFNLQDTKKERAWLMIWHLYEASRNRAPTWRFQPTKNLRKRRWDPSSMSMILILINIRIHMYEFENPHVPCYFSSPCLPRNWTVYGPDDSLPSIGVLFIPQMMMRSHCFKPSIKSILLRWFQRSFYIPNVDTDLVAEYNSSFNKEFQAYMLTAGIRSIHAWLTGYTGGVGQASTKGRKGLTVGWSKFDSIEEA